MHIPSWIRGKRQYVTARQLPILLQGILHIVAIYVVARTLVPWHLEQVHNTEQYFAPDMIYLGLSQELERVGT